LATRKVKLRGIAFWCKCFASNRDLTGFEDALKEVGGQTTIDLDIDEDNFAKLKQSKSMKKGTKSPDNPKLTRVKLTRKWESPYEGLGGAPEVIKADGTVWDLDVDGFIGNGSEVEVVLSVYDTKRPSIVGTRMDKVIVVNPIKYTPPDAEDDTPKVEDKPKAKVDADLNDDLPF
jgi:hypothetical protein